MISDAQKLRILWVADHASYAMDTTVKFKNGTAHGTVSWTDHTTGIPRKKIQRWITPTFQKVLSVFTVAVMQDTYGIGFLSTPAEARSEKVVIRYSWKEHYATLYHGFSSARACNKWLATHGDWIEDFKRIR